MPSSRPVALPARRAQAHLRVPMSDDAVRAQGTKAPASSARRQAVTLLILREPPLIRTCTPALRNGVPLLRSVGSGTAQPVVLVAFGNTRVHPEAPF